MHQILYRGFWRRWVFVLVLLFIVITVGIVKYRKVTVVTEKYKTPLSQFKWLDHYNLSFPQVCRNSKQGPVLIADEKGHVCAISDVLPNGCCDQNGNSTHRFYCLTCRENRCCHVFEHCISCCLQPHKRKILESVLVHAQRSRNPLLRSVKDTFELCLHKCRTSSTSVIRENKYRDNLHKYCYGLDAPDFVERKNVLRK